MQTHSAAETVYSATYVDDYMDYVENLPQEIQYYITKVHELDLLYRGFLKDVKFYKDILAKDDVEVNIQKKTLYKLEQIFISLQEVGDEKVEIGQVINDLIDNKFRNVDQDLKSLDCYKENDSEPTKEISRDVIQAKDTITLSSNTGSIDKNGSNQGNERASKRSRRSRNEAETLDSPIMETRTTSSTKISSGANISGGTSSSITGNSGSGSVSKSAGSAAANKKKKRKTRQREETPPKEEELVHEIDEPTYCLCDQISYGEMIMCDNDLCPIEWFHFLCVSLSTKPKGKWFCPMCRGDRPNIMKPKPQFLKELERYNKEKEEKA